MLAALAAQAAAATPPPAIASAHAAAGLPPLSGEAIRFTVVQPEGRGATVYQAERGARGPTRTIVDLATMPGGWAVAGRETKPLATETLDYFRGRIDAALAGQPQTCTDSPQYYAEHGDRGIAGCGQDGATGAIARALGLADPVQP